jgi:cytochrome c oxidase cbb3-type subunit I/II
MMNPRSVAGGSIMPAYPWLAKKKTDFLVLRRKLSIMKSLGVPYTEEEVTRADLLAEAQAKKIADELTSQGAPTELHNKEIVALIAYLQALGQKGKK